MSHIKEIPPKQLMPGISGHYTHGQNMTFGLVEIAAGTVMPVHQHGMSKSLTAWKDNWIWRLMVWHIH